MMIGIFSKGNLTEDNWRVRKRLDAAKDDGIVEFIPEKTECIGWAYVGSHNFTQAAWGTLSGSSFNPTLNASRSIRPWHESH